MPASVRLEASHTATTFHGLQPLRFVRAILGALRTALGIPSLTFSVLTRHVFG